MSDAIDGQELISRDEITVALSAALKAIGNNRLGQLLDYLVNQDPNTISARNIAEHFFPDKAHDEDYLRGQGNVNVRANGTKLRRALDDYYNLIGKDDPVRIRLRPKELKVTFERIGSAAVVPPSMVSSNPEPSLRGTSVRALTPSLAEAVVHAEEYLQHQSLNLSDSIAEAVRRSFERSGTPIECCNLIPYLSSSVAANRVVGYIAYQVSPQTNMALNFVAALRREKEEAATHRETRPLWQLLVCIGLLLQLELDRSEVEVVRAALRERLDWLKSEPSIDPGGECKRRIALMLDGRSRLKAGRTCLR